MNVIGIILFIIGVLSAVGLAVNAISYLKSNPFYKYLKKTQRAFFGISAVIIVTLFTTLIGQVFLSQEMMNKTGAVIASLVSGTDNQTIEVAEEAKEATEETTETALEEPAQPKSTEVAPAEEPATKEEPVVTEEPVATEEPQPEPTQPAQPIQPAQPTQPATQAPAKKSTLIPTFSVWTNIYKGHQYAYVEVENGIPYVYAPTLRGSFWYNLNNIRAGKEGNNIVVMANAGVFNDDSSPKGTTIQNSKVVSVSDANTKRSRTLVIDETGNVGYANGVVKSNTASYIDALTGKTITGRKIVSAVTGFSPVVINGKPATQYKDTVMGYRARQMFCVRKSNAFTIITNTGEGEDGGGWSFDDMATVAIRRGCQFAFNLDGGGSTALAWRTSLALNFSTYATTERKDPTFIVFTADNLAPTGK